MKSGSPASGRSRRGRESCRVGRVERDPPAEPGGSRSTRPTLRERDTDQTASSGPIMDLNTICEVTRPRSREEVAPWRTGDAWLAGGTWLFSEPQPDIRRLTDLE